MLLLEDKLAKYKKLYIPSKLGGIIDEEDYLDVDEVGYDAYHIGALDWSHGVSKMAIIDKDSTYVLKIPFNVEWNAAWDCENETYDYDNAYANYFDCDYCALEAEIYEIFKDAGFGCFLARTKFYDECSSGWMTVQERCYHIGERRSSKETREALKVFKSKEYDYIGITMPIDLFGSFVEAYGLDLTLKFIQFCRENDYNILDDLHSGNYGYRADGTPCIIDFSSWK